MNITVIGTGYVGLVTGACFAEMGHTVLCVDVDPIKISNLKIGILPIYEPGLENIVESNFKAGRLQFTTDIAAAMSECNVLFIAVGTPPGEDGSADLQYVLKVADEIGGNLSQYSVIVDKSTVPVGTGEKVRNRIQAQLDKRLVSVDFDVVSNPEFLKEGAAVRDFMSPDRIVVGAENQRAKDVMSELYAPFIRNHPRMVFMNIKDAEMTKYAANAMLATKISFMNEIAGICEKLGADIENVRLGIGSDQRIGFHFIYPGAGYGGSCFPKDVQALVQMSQKIGFDAKVLKAVEQRNSAQKNRLFEKIVGHFGDDLSSFTFAVWGLAFKPGTDDMREAPSLVLIHSLLKAGASVRAFDPVAMETARKDLDPEHFSSGKLVFGEDQYSILKDVDALVLVTEWKLFRNPDYSILSKELRNKLIFDGRNQYDPIQLNKLGYSYYGIGREFKKS